jgi:hypothetical protein
MVASTTGRGVRTHCYDDFFVAALATSLIDFSGDTDVLRENIHFLRDGRS